MPVAGQRDPEQVRTALQGWLARQMPDATSIEITHLEVPQSSGFSNETFLIDARWKDSSGDVSAELVLRSQPQVHQLFPEVEFLDQQFRTMKLLGEHTDVPVATMRWAESDPAVLGAPFFVMDRLHGQVPADTPPFTTEGFVVEMSDSDRAVWHRNAVAAMAKVGMVDWRAIGFDYLDKAHHGTLGPEQRRNYFRHYWEWANKGAPHPVVDPAWEWLEANWPDDGDQIQLCWGDARPGNQMFQGTEVVGVFDWEMVSLGNAESDLGWWLFLQRYMTTGVEADLLPGMLDHQATVAYWEEITGRTVRHLDFYERLAGFQFCLVMIKLNEMFIMDNADFAAANMAVDNPVARITDELIGIGYFD